MESTFIIKPNKSYFYNFRCVKEFGSWDEFGNNTDGFQTFDDLKAIAQAQSDADNIVQWALHGSFKS